MDRKLTISYYTAKEMLMELLANNKLLEDEEIKVMLKDMALQKNEEDRNSSMNTPIIIDTECRLFFPMYSDKEVKMSYLPKQFIFFLASSYGCRVQESRPLFKRIVSDLPNRFRREEYRSQKNQKKFRKPRFTWK